MHGICPIHRERQSEAMTSIELPRIGFGTADLEDQAEAAVEAAIRAGFRLIDTARVYGSEESVGRAVAKCISDGIVRREDLIIQTKLDPSLHSYEGAIESFKASLKALNMEYVDLYLIHWPVPRGAENDCYERNREVWRAFEALQKNGEVRNLGVCNFLERHLLDLLDHCTVPPVLNQLELHPAFQQRGLVRFVKKLGMKIEAWSPMGRGLLNNDEWKARAGAYGKNPGQVALRWSIDQGFIPLVRAKNPEHIRSNLEFFDFTLTEKDRSILDGMNTNDQHMDIWSYKRQQMY